MFGINKHTQENLCACRYTYSSAQDLHAKPKIPSALVVPMIIGTFAHFPCFSNSLGAAGRKLWLVTGTSTHGTNIIFTPATSSCIQIKYHNYFLRLAADNTKMDIEDAKQNEGNAWARA